MKHKTDSASYFEIISKVSKLIFYSIMCNIWYVVRAKLNKEYYFTISKYVRLQV